MIEVNLDSEAPLISRLQRIITASTLTVAVTGAGISRASGLPVLSSSIGGHPVAGLFDRTAWQSDPQLYFRLYRTALREWRKAVPNEAHHALAKRNVWVVTQNVDGLHRDAGSVQLLELHGNLRELRCEGCEAIYSTSLAWGAVVPRCPRCRQVLKPGVSFVGEEIRHFSQAVDWAGRANVLLALGTSLSMQPVAELPRICDRNGGLVILCNDGAERIVPLLLNYVSTMKPHG